MLKARRHGGLIPELIGNCFFIGFIGRTVLQRDSCRPAESGLTQSIFPSLTSPCPPTEEKRRLLNGTTCRTTMLQTTRRPKESFLALTNFCLVKQELFSRRKKFIAGRRPLRRSGRRPRLSGDGPLGPLLPAFSGHGGPDGARAILYCGCHGSSFRRQTLFGARLKRSGGGATPCGGRQNGNSSRQAQNPDATAKMARARMILAPAGMKIAPARTGRARVPNAAADRG